MDAPFPPDQPTFLTWLARNPTGIPRSIALTRALLGATLAGLFSAAAARRARRAAPPPAHLNETLGAVLVGPTAGPLCVTVMTYRIDRALLRRDELLRYSRVMREIFHAGLAGGVLVGAFGKGMIGAAVYAVRGLGPGLGAGPGCSVASLAACWPVLPYSER